MYILHIAGLHNQLVFLTSFPYCKPVGLVVFVHQQLDAVE